MIELRQGFNSRKKTTQSHCVQVSHGPTNQLIEILRLKPILERRNSYRGEELKGKIKSSSSLQD